MQGKHVGAGDEVRLAVAKTDYHTQGIVQAILMVAYNEQGCAVFGDGLGVYVISLLVIYMVVHESQVSSEQAVDDARLLHVVIPFHIVFSPLCYNLPAPEDASDGKGSCKITNKKRNILLFLHICFCFVQNRVLNTTFRTAYFLFLTLEVPFFIPHLSSRALRASFICFTPEFFPARLGKVFFR